MTPDEFRAALAKAGITETKPLYPVLVTIHEAAETALATVTNKARGLTPEGEAALIARVSREAADATEAKVERLVRRFDVRAASLVAVTGLGMAAGGYWLGVQQGAQALEGAAFLAHVAEMNDVRALRRHCQQHSYPQSGGTACTLPPVWVRRSATP